MKAKTKFTKLWSILLALAMVVGILPIAALAAGSATATADFVSDPTKALALLNDAKIGTTASTWDGSTLTLGGVNFTTTAATAVKLPDGAKITLADGTTNTIKGGDAATGDCYGIYGEGNLTIQGTGTLNVTSGTAGNLSFGIHAQNSVTINSGAVTATGGAAPNNQSFGIRALNNDLTIEGGNVKAKGGEARVSSNGLWAGNGSVVISGGEVEAESGRVMPEGVSSGIYANNVEINNTGAIVTATGGTAQNAYSFGIYVYRGKGTFSGGTLTAATKDTTCINGTFDVTGSGVKTISFDRNGGSGTMMAKTTAEEYTLPANGFTAPDGKQFKAWSVNGTEKAVGDTITVTANTTVYAQWTSHIPSVAITGIDAPKSNKALDTEADCNTTGVSNAKPTVTWDSSDSKAGYGKIYTASITLTASEGYVFADSTTVTVNGNPATSVTKNANGTLTVTYTFPATDKHNIELTLNTEIHDGDAVKNPTISSGYEIEICFFVEDTNKNGDFTDDKTLLLDKALVEEFIARPEIDMTLEEFIAALKDEGLDDVKTEYTGGYNYSFIAMVKHNEEVSFDDDEDGKVTDAIVKVNGKDITEKCGGGSALTVNPGAYVFSAAKTYTVSFDANGGSGTMADVTGVLGDYTLPENGFTAPDGKQFKAWSVDGKEKAVGDKITVTADTTVKAVWETLPATPADYDILNGANSKWTQDSDGNISVRGSGEFSKFVGVKVDGKTVDEKYYTVKEGSTIVTLKPEYLNTLTAGKHTLEIVWTDGTADTTFTVDAKPANTDTKSPQTGDSSSIALWIALLFVSAAGVLSTAVLGKKKKRSAK